MSGPLCVFASRRISGVAGASHVLKPNAITPSARVRRTTALRRFRVTVLTREELRHISASLFSGSAGMDVGPAYERGGARGGRTSDRASADSGDIGCCGATLIVARIQSLEGSDPPSGRRQHTCPPVAARPPRGGWPPLWAPEDTCPHATDDLFETGDVPGGDCRPAPALAAQDKWADESLQSSTFMPGEPVFLRSSRRASCAGTLLARSSVGGPGVRLSGDSDSEVWRLCHRGGSNSPILRRSSRTRGAPHVRPPSRERIGVLAQLPLLGSGLGVNCRGSSAELAKDGRL